MRSRFYHPRAVRPVCFEPASFPDHALLDSGGSEKLERFGELVLARPDPQALWRRRLEAPAWSNADLTFVRESDRGGRWEPRTHPALKEGWVIAFDEARLRIRPTPFKHVGLFPEQAANWRWMRPRLAALGPRPRLLNLFGYTGAASVLAARWGADVTHVDASKTVLAWTQENAHLSGLPEGALRLVLDDALSYARREARRGARYHGILLDPPHHGRGPRGEKWQLELGLAPLIEACGELLSDRAFLVLSCYAVGYSPLAFVNLLAELEGGDMEAGELVLPEADGERLLPCGFCARWQRGLERPS
jgi:23S rRNA (cytosine1962-C5)-methyltransferase